MQAVACKDTTTNVNRWILAKAMLAEVADNPIQHDDDNIVPQIASKEEYFEISKLLLEEGADIDTPTAERHTALTLAAEEGHVEIVKLLIDAGTAINTQDRHDNTALMLAAKAGHVDIVELLIDADVNNPENAFDMAALSLALESEHIAMVSVLTLAYHQQQLPKPSLTITADMAATIAEHLAEQFARQAMIQSVLETLPFNANAEDTRPLPRMVLDLILRLKPKNAVALISEMLDRQYDSATETWQTKAALPNELKYDRILQDVVSDFCNDPKAYVAKCSRQNFPSLPQVMPNNLPPQLSHLRDALLQSTYDNILQDVVSEPQVMLDTLASEFPPLGEAVLEEAAFQSTNAKSTSSIYKTVFWQPLQEKKPKAQLEAAELIRGLYTIEPTPSLAI